MQHRRKLVNCRRIGACCNKIVFPSCLLQKTRGCLVESPPVRVLESRGGISSMALGAISSMQTRNERTESPPGLPQMAKGPNQCELSPQVGFLSFHLSFQFFNYSLTHPVDYSFLSQLPFANYSFLSQLPFATKTLPKSSGKLQIRSRYSRLI